MFSIGFIIIAVIIVVALLILFSFVPVGLWISALAAGVHVGICLLYTSDAADEVRRV